MQQQNLNLHYQVNNSTVTAHSKSTSYTNHNLIPGIDQFQHTLLPHGVLDVAVALQLLYMESHVTLTNTTKCMFITLKY